MNPPWPIVTSRWMLRAAAAPERFLDRGFARFLSETKGKAVAARTSRASSSTRARTNRSARTARTTRRTRITKSTRSSSARAAKLTNLRVALPADLVQFLDALDGNALADFAPRPRALPSLASIVAAARRGTASTFARLVCLLAGAVPFGETRGGDVVAYFLADAPARGVIVQLAPGRNAKAELVCRGAAELAVICSLQAMNADIAFEARPFNIADEEAISSLIDRARVLASILVGTDAQVRTAMRSLALKPLDVPAPDPISSRSPTAAGTKTKTKTPKLNRASLALGPLFEAFFREPAEDLEARIAEHRASGDSIVQECGNLLSSALSDESSSKKRPTALAKDLSRRREIALRALSSLALKQATRIAAAGEDEDTMALTKRIAARIDALPPNAEAFAAVHEREETLLALDVLGDRAIAPALLDRALTGDANAVDMLAALGDRSLLPHLDRLLDAEPSRVRLYEASVARMLVAIGAKEAQPALRRWLDENPMTGWREGLERGVLVRELVIALGELEDETSASRLLAILESTHQEYRAVLPAAAYALGRLRHVPALSGLERLLFSPKDPVTCEAVWAVGMLGQADASARDNAIALLDRLATSGLEPGAEATRLAALAKLRLLADTKTGRAQAPKTADLRRAIDRALWEPAFRQEETSRRRAWALRAVEELALLTHQGAPGIDAGALFLGHESIRHLVTRDDHRVRRAAVSAFAAWELPVPKVRTYFSFGVSKLEQEGGVDALLEAVRDPLGVFRHNVATRLAEIGDTKSIRPLAEATARLFAEPPTSTYEYDDAPPHLVAFVRALARLNRPESNDVLIEGLRSDNHQVRAVIAENAPEDERFVPELMAMLGDPRSFLRSRAEKSLTSLGAIPQPIEPATTEVAAIPATKPVARAHDA